MPGSLYQEVQTGQAALRASVPALKAGAHHSTGWDRLPGTSQGGREVLAKLISIERLAWAARGRGGRLSRCACPTSSIAPAVAQGAVCSRSSTRFLHHEIPEGAGGRKGTFLSMQGPALGVVDLSPKAG